ncbi:MAG: dockerin type I domain-containing protein, partial [bacterium]
FGGVCTAVAIDEGDCNPRRIRTHTLALAWCFVILLGLLHTATVTRFSSYPANSAASAVFGAGNEEVSMQFKKMAAVVSSTLAMSAGAHAQDAVQWRVENGGNGHWYQGVQVSADISWDAARSACESLGGHLATLTGPAEDNFVWAIARLQQNWVIVNGPGWTGAKGPWLGLFQTPGSATAEGWNWVTEELFTWAHSSFVPNDGCTSDENALNYIGGVPGSREWNDFPGDQPCSVWGFPRAYIIEWSADCNSDGIVDYSQIRAGELVDANVNNIPDCCEESTSCSPCPGDIDESGTVNGVDLAAILTVWGSDGGKYPRADTNNDGEVNGADLATVLGSWGPCE